MKTETVFVGLSGGVDSSVAAKRLIEAGNRVVGVFIKVWQPDFLVCDWEKERLDAMRVAAHLDIPFLTFDAEATYKKEVADYMIREYGAGRTPNPDVMCNQHVKFGAFLEFALTHGADKVATGHYARVTQEGTSYKLLRGTDPTKDQSYFLWTLTQAQLSKIYFPIGDTHKVDIRKEAEAAGIPTFAKHDSQGICFLGQVDIPEFLSHYITVEPGPVLDTQGVVVGTHKGAFFYTLGQRHGFTLNTTTTDNTPLYVVAKDIAKNTITVDRTPKMVREDSDTIALVDLNMETTIVQETLEAEFRYRQQPCSVTFMRTGTESGTLKVTDHNIEYPSSGQSCVLYRGDQCFGGGIIA